MTNDRVSWIDIAKALSLVLVVLIHSIPRNEISAILTGFVMPAFFILYGVAHNNEKHRSNLPKYFFSRFRSLMVPYIILSILMIVMYGIVYPSIDFGFTPTENLLWFIYGNGPIGRVSHLWFLRTMFIAVVLFSFVDKYLHDRPASLRVLLLIILPILGVLLKTISGIELVPWGIDSVLISLSFMMIGNEIRKYNYLSPWTIDKTFDSITLLLSVIVYIPLASFNGFVNIGESLYGQSIIIYMITGILGTYLLCSLSYHISRTDELITKIATSFNKYGQEVYEIHPLMIELNVQIVGLFVSLSILTLYSGAIVYIVNFITALLIPYLIASKVIRKSHALQLVFLGKKYSIPEIVPEAPIVKEPYIEVSETIFRITE